MPLDLTDIGFHDTDTGGADNPAQWGDRPAADRERWGDDYAAATIHKHMIFYRALKAQAPEVRFDEPVAAGGICLRVQGRLSLQGRGRGRYRNRGRNPFFFVDTEPDTDSDPDGSGGEGTDTA